MFWQELDRETNGMGWDGMRQESESEEIVADGYALTCSGMGWSITEEGWTCCRLAVASETGGV